MTFGENLKRIRKERGLTQARLGELVGIDRTTVSKYEQARPMDASHIRKIESRNHQPTVSTITKLAKALDCTIGELFGEELQIIHEPPKGKWQVYQVATLGVAWTIQCSHCKAIGFHGMTPYCPECGAQMMNVELQKGQNNADTEMEFQDS